MHGRQLVGRRGPVQRCTEELMVNMQGCDQKKKSPVN